MAKGSRKQETIQKTHNGSSPHWCREEKQNQVTASISPDCIASVSWICSERTGAILQKAASALERKQTKVVLISGCLPVLLRAHPPPFYRCSRLNTAVPSPSNYTIRTACTPPVQLPLETKCIKLSFTARGTFPQSQPWAGKPVCSPAIAKDDVSISPIKDPELTPRPAPPLDNPRSRSSTWAPLSLPQTGGSLMSLHLPKTSSMLAAEMANVVCALLDASALILCKSPYTG